jgi:uncharacterized protein YukE
MPEPLGMQYLVESLDELGALVQSAKPDAGRWSGQAALGYQREVEQLAHDLVALRNHLATLPHLAVVVG